MRHVFLTLLFVPFLGLGNDKKALEAAIAAHPDEDTPRLVYADWLDEHEDAERAQLIRVQIELSHTPEADPKYTDLKKQESALLKHESRWIPDNFKRAVGGNGSVEWRRGFIEGVRITRMEALTSAEARSAIDALPLLHSFTINLQKSQMGAAETTAAVESLLRFKSLPRLKHLRLSGLYLSDAHAGLLAEAPLGSLRSFDLGISEMAQGGGSTRLIAAPWMANLRSLELLRVVAWGDAPDGTANLPELIHLSLPHAHWAPLAAGNGMPKLKSLTVAVRAADTADAETFLSSKRFAGLSAFRLDTRAYSLNQDAPEDTPWLGNLVARVTTHGKHLAVFEVHQSGGLSSSQEKVPVHLPESFVAQLKSNAAAICGMLADLLGGQP